MTLHLDTFDTPIGTLALVVDDEGRMRACGFTTDHSRMTRLLKRDASQMQRTRNPAGVSVALRAYFEGDLAALDRLDVQLLGTAFQRRVWNALRTIPLGHTWSYAQLATDIGHPAAVRAVGLANGANPVGLVVPCHRVIGKHGKLTGYGGGLDRKRWLLEHEGACETLDLRSHRPVGHSLVGGGVADAFRREPELVERAR